MNIRRYQSVRRLLRRDGLPSHLSIRVLLAAGLLLLTVTGLGMLFAAPGSDKNTPAASSSGIKPAAADNKPSDPAPPVIVPRSQLDKVPKEKEYILITPEEHRQNEERKKELERLKARETRKTVPPTECALTKGEVKGNILHLQAQVKFATSGPGVVFLACHPARVSSALYKDGRTPVLHGSATEGYSVEVDQAGLHQLTLELRLELLVKGNERSFVLNLPRAALTSLDLQLPAGVRNWHAASPAPDNALTREGNRLYGDALGAIDKLELSWKGPRVAAGGAPLLTAEGLVEVQIGAHEMTTHVTLTLKALVGQTQVWQVLVPFSTNVGGAAEEDRARIARIENVDDKSRTFALKIIHLKEAEAGPLTLTLRHTQRVGPQPLAVGPFLVLGATRQQGRLLISNTAPDLHLEPRPHNGLQQDVVTEDDLKRRPNVVDAFTYTLPATPERRPNTSGPKPSPWLEVEANPVRGQLQTRVEHKLTLKPLEDDKSLPLSWEVATTIKAVPSLTEVDTLRVKLPADCDYLKSTTTDPASKFRGDFVEGSGRDRTVIIKLARQARKAGLDPFTVSLRCLYRAPLGSEGRVTLELPQPENTTDQGGDTPVTIEAPPAYELLVPESSPGNPELKPALPNKQKWGYFRRPSRVTVAWRPYRPAVPVQSWLDVTFTSSTGHVRHTLKFPLAPAAHDPLTLRVPREVRELRAVNGTIEPAAGTTRVRRTKDTLILDYDFPLPASGGEGAPVFEVPVVAPADAAPGDTLVRVWGPVGYLPELVGAGWTAQNIEPVPEHAQLPALVLRGPLTGAAPKLRLNGEGTELTVLVDRALVRVEVDASGVQKYRARYRIARLTVPELEVELPRAVRDSSLRITLDGTIVEPHKGAQADAAPEERPVVRLVLPLVSQKPAVLEFTYERGRTGASLVQTSFQAPILRGAAGQVPTRWMVLAPRSWVIVGPEGSPGTERGWSRRGWLLAPALAVRADDLERWFGSSGGGEEESRPISFVRGQEDESEWVLVHAPQQAWLLTCSLALVVVGLGLGWLTRPADGQGLVGAWFWPALAALVLAAVVASLFWPTTLTAVAYGCQPGALVLLTIAVLQGLRHARYRRQVVFLPSFSRPRTGASMGRGQATPLPSKGPPSTVDAPRPLVGSSHGPTPVPTEPAGPG